MKRVAIIGGGFSGVMVLANLVEQASSPLSILLFESSGEAGEGAAYGTKNNAHLLNVRANRMGAFAGQQEGFWEWLQDSEGKIAAQQLWPGHAVTAECFAPRMVYAAYIKSILRTALEKAKAKHLSVHIHHAAVSDIDIAENAAITAGSETYPADYIVLATGHHAPRSFLPVATPGYYDNPWHALRDAGFRDRVHSLGADDIITIIGTGLTAVDAVLSLHTLGYKGKTVIVSRNGWLPAQHTMPKPYPAWKWVTSPSSIARRLSQALLEFRMEIERAQKNGYDWRDVVDSLRPVSQQLWQQLGIREKQQFLKRLATVWNVHRHRMAPEIAKTLDTLQNNGRLSILAARLKAFHPTGNGIEVEYQPKGQKKTTAIISRMVINCTGPQYNVTEVHNPLIQKLLKRGYITPSPLKSGIELTSSGTAKGTAENRIYPIGALTVGEQIEGVAVPELRELSHWVAQSILAA